MVVLASGEGGLLVLFFGGLQQLQRATQPPGSLIDASFIILNRRRRCGTGGGAAPGHVLGALTAGPSFPLSGGRARPSRCGICLSGPSTLVFVRRMDNAPGSGGSTLSIARTTTSPKGGGCGPTVHGPGPRRGGLRRRLVDNSLRRRDVIVTRDGGLLAFAPGE